MNDLFYGNYTISQIGGISLHELNTLEQEFLEIIEFDLNVNLDEYHSYLNGLQQFFKEPLHIDTRNIIEEVFQSLNEVHSRQQQVNKDAFITKLPSSRLHAMYETHIQTQLKMNQIMSQPEINIEKMSAIQTEQVLIMQQYCLQNVSSITQIKGVMELQMATIQQELNILQGLQDPNSQLLFTQKLAILQQLTQQIIAFQTQLQQQIDVLTFLLMLTNNQMNISSQSINQQIIPDQINSSINQQMQQQSLQQQNQLQNLQNDQPKH